MVSTIRRAFYFSFAGLLFPALNHAAFKNNFIAPGENWAEYPIRVEASHGIKNIVGVKKNRQITIKFPREKEAWISWEHEAIEKRDFIISYSVAPFVSVRLEKKIAGANKWETLKQGRPGPFLNKFEYKGERGTVYRILFEKPESSKLKVWNLGFYKPLKNGRNDYWLVLGASIQNQSMRQAWFAPKIRSHFPNANPILFNEAVKGWGIHDVYNNLPAILESHPFATYVCIHVGGNNISSNRPYPGAEEELSRMLNKLVTYIRQSGKIPILGRPSFRKYKTPPQVPPLENGSGPYAERVYDPIIMDNTPYFFDFSKRKGVIDLYDFIRLEPSYLSDDGIHLTSRGGIRWCEYWARKVGPIVYGNGPVAAYTGPYTIMINLNRDKTLRFPFLRTENFPKGSKITISNPSGKLLATQKLNEAKRHETQVLMDLSFLEENLKKTPYLKFSVYMGASKKSGKIILMQ